MKDDLAVVVRCKTQLTFVQSIVSSEKSNEVIANKFLENLRNDGEDRYRSVIFNIVFTPLFVNRSGTSQFELSWADTVKDQFMSSKA